MELLVEIKTYCLFRWRGLMWLYSAYLLSCKEECWGKSRSRELGPVTVARILRANWVRRTSKEQRNLVRVFRYVADREDH
jgi:hypothetical protein